MGISRTWQPALPWACGQLGVGAGLLAALPLVERPGWVLVLPAALALLAFAARDLLLRPVLTADPDGLEVVSGVRRDRASWEQVERLREVRDRRTPLLEIDLGDRLVVLTARRLGSPVEDVLAALEQLRQAN